MWITGMRLIQFPQPLFLRVRPLHSQTSGGDKLDCLFGGVGGWGREEGQQLPQVFIRTASVEQLFHHSNSQSRVLVPHCACVRACVSVCVRVCLYWESILGVGSDV